MIDIRKIEHGYWWDAQEKFILLKHRVMSLREITIQVTDRCNKACPKCNKVNMSSEDMPAAEVIRIIDEACDLGLKHIHFTGGEPTLHPDFLDIVRHCRSRGLRIDMSSNGCFSAEYARGLDDAGINSVNVSWDFIGDKPRCLEHMVLKADLFVNHMVMPSNFESLPGFLYVMKNTPVYDRIIDIQLMPPRGTAEKFNLDQVVWFNDRIVPKALEIAGDRFPMVKSKLSRMLSLESIRGVYHVPIQWPCHRSKAELRVGVRGFTTCTYLYRDGKVTCGLDMSVKDAWLKCRAMARKSPPLRMCETSCSPEVTNFNYFVDQALKGTEIKDEHV